MKTSNAVVGASGASFPGGVAVVSIVTAAGFRVYHNGSGLVLKIVRDESAIRSFAGPASGSHARPVLFDIYLNRNRTPTTIGNVSRALSLLMPARSVPTS